LVYTRGVPSGQVQRLDGATNREQILEAVAKAAQQAGPQGTVWVYFAGHGAASPVTGERVLLGVDVQPDVNTFEARAVRMSELRKAATASGGRANLVLDTCYSGRGRGGSSLMGGKRFAVPSFAIDSNDDVVEWLAASPNEMSGPLEVARHGAFTYLAIGALRGWADGQLTGVRDGIVTAEEAHLYVDNGLRSLGIDDQTPVLVAENASTTVLASGVSEQGPDDLRPAAASFTPEAPQAGSTLAPKPVSAIAPASVVTTQAPSTLPTWNHAEDVIVPGVGFDGLWIGRSKAQDIIGAWGCPNAESSCTETTLWNADHSFYSRRGCGIELRLTDLGVLSSVSFIGYSQCQAETKEGGGLNAGWGRIIKAHGKTQAVETALDWQTVLRYPGVDFNMVQRKVNGVVLRAD
jgi:hypothetical protein